MADYLLDTNGVPWSVDPGYSLGARRGAAPAELRKGPRGGGRDRDQMIDYVPGAETSYTRKLELKDHQSARDDAPAITALRDDIVAALQAPSDGTPLAWPPRSTARRIAWHILDHNWELVPTL